MANIIIKGYVKEASKDGRKFKIYNAVGKDGNNNPIYATISFCKEAQEEFKEIEKSFGKSGIPKMFQFEVPAENTNVKEKLVYALDENGEYRCNANGELITFNHTKIYIDGNITNFVECDTVFEGIGKTAEGMFGR